jgi:carboxyl-terminal processing protease
MNWKLFGLVLAFAGALQANTPTAEQPQFPTFKPLQQQPLAARLTAKLIEQHHYRPVALDDRLSEKIFDAYLKSLDSDKMFFLQSDIDQWKGSRTKLDDALLTETLDVPFAIFNLYAKRSIERYDFARSLLKDGFDFQQNESFQFNREKEPWAKSETEIRDIWRKRVKNDWLALKIAGKDDKQIAETLNKRYENSVKRINKLKSEDAFQIFMNAYTMSVDPHTNYMAPRTSEDFDISMRLSLVGIGAVLEEKDDYATIKELVPGSPAALSEKLKPGDRIAGVAQGEAGTMTDVVGWRLDDTVALIRGAADSVVVLDVLPAGASPDSQHQRVSLIRKKIKLEDQAAKKSIVPLDDKPGGRRIGVISLPTFYEDFQARQKGDPDYKSATRDVSRLLEELKAEKVDAVLMDLRNNGGGSLTEAIELSGLFLGAGPVVQQRDADGDVTVGKGMAPGAVWDGPLGVLINRASASASEIFAAAIQDYHRGLVIGETSYGKGTVQTMIDLDRSAHEQASQLGDLKLTIAQFFRINGGTTQLRGVTPDISLPAISDAEHFGESSFENGLPWMRIKPANYHALSDLQKALPALQQRHDRRIATDKDFQNLLEDIAEINQQRQKNQITLNESERRKERDALEARRKLREGEQKPGDKTPGPNTAANSPSGHPDPGKDEDDEFDLKGKKGKDTWLKEAANILGDSIDLLKDERPDLAAGTSAPSSTRSAKKRVLQ